eukprot:COSAG05_NODE_6721_length_914_cov_1.463804_2_plen_45_part_01
MHVRAQPASQQESCMRARGQPVTRGAARQSAGFMHVRARPGSQQD